VYPDTMRPFPRMVMQTGILLWNKKKSNCYKRN